MRNWINIITESIEDVENVNDMELISKKLQFPDEINQHILKVCSGLIAKGYTVSVGRLRVAFIDPTHRIVIKVPLSQDGDQANWFEARHWKSMLKAREIFPVAACRYTKIDNLQVLLMAFVKTISGPIVDKPNWVDWVDCQQVGYDNKGRLVAYDL